MPKKNEGVPVKLPVRLVAALRELARRTGIPEDHLHRAAVHKLLNEREELVKLWQDQAAEFEAIEAELPLPPILPESEEDEGD